MKTDGIILDIDGTVWDSTKLVASAWNKAISNSSIPGAQTIAQQNLITSELLKTVFGKTMDIIADELFPSLSPKNRYALLDECDISERQFLLDNKDTITYPNVITTIKKLSQKYKIFIVSNCQKGYIESCLDQNSLWPYISAIECFGNTGKQKDFNIAKIIQENNLTTPVYVGDTQGDFEAAQKNNIPFIWASYGFGAPKAYTTKIKDFSDLLSIFP